MNKPFITSENLQTGGTMIDPDQIRIGTLLKFKANKEDTDLYALVIDIDDDQENPILFHILIGDKTYWQYLSLQGWEIIK